MNSFSQLIYYTFSIIPFPKFITELSLNLYNHISINLVFYSLIYINILNPIIATVLDEYVLLIEFWFIMFLVWFLWVLFIITSISINNLNFMKVWIGFSFVLVCFLIGEYSNVVVYVTFILWLISYSYFNNQFIYNLLYDLGKCLEYFPQSLIVKFAKTNVNAKFILLHLFIFWFLLPLFIIMLDCESFLWLVIIVQLLYIIHDHQFSISVSITLKYINSLLYVWAAKVITLLPVEFFILLLILILYLLFINLVHYQFEPNLSLLEYVYGVY